MINKEDYLREIAKQEMSKAIMENLDSALIFSYINNLENRIKELEEINAEHQKLNGELQQKVTRYEEILAGKSIQELGTSDYYKEEK